MKLEEAVRRGKMGRRGEETELDQELHPGEMRRRLERLETGRRELDLQQQLVELQLLEVRRDSRS